MEDNLFDTASNILGGKKKAAASKDKKSPPVRRSEAEVMLEKMHMMKVDLDQKITDLRQLGKKKGIDVDQYFNLDKVSSPSEFKKILEFQEQLEAKVDKIIPPETLPKMIEKPIDKLTKERKGKLRGAMRNWIPMK